VGQVAENIDESLSHLATHVQVGVFVLKQVDGVLDRAIRGQIFDYFSVYEEKDLHLVLWQVRIFVLVV
jgi:hypothetical protein